MKKVQFLNIIHLKILLIFCGLSSSVFSQYASDYITEAIRYLHEKEIVPVFLSQAEDDLRQNIYRRDLLVAIYELRLAMDELSSPITLSQIQNLENRVYKVENILTSENLTDRSSEGEPVLSQEIMDEMNSLLANVPRYNDLTRIEEKVKIDSIRIDSLSETIKKQQSNKLFDVKTVINLICVLFAAAAAVGAANH